MYIVKWQIKCYDKSNQKQAYLNLDFKLLKLCYSLSTFYILLARNPSVFIGFAPQKSGHYQHFT